MFYSYVFFISFSDYTLNKNTNLFLGFIAKNPLFNIKFVDFSPFRIYEKLNLLKIGAGAIIFFSRFRIAHSL